MGRFSSVDGGLRVHLHERQNEKQESETVEAEQNFFFLLANPNSQYEMYENTVKGEWPREKVKSKNVVTWMDEQELWYEKSRCGEETQQY